MTTFEDVRRARNVIQFPKSEEKRVWISDNFFVGVGVAAGIVGAAIFVITTGWAWICALFSLA